MKNVMVFGTFDILHKGHEDFFRQARKLGEYLIVIVARDKNVLKIKGKLPRNGEIVRQRKIVESKLADEVAIGSIEDRYKIIQEFKPNVICLGYDQKVSERELREKLIEFGLAKTKIIRLDSFFPEIYKSSKL
ncbi:adenylyltransferase/cytidyltransferase family protein [Patescibacteria group bacterium]|nr:adenylyltransferase/cytidyltransferase family protein [Patescibacteria group bacterium]